MIDIRLLHHGSHSLVDISFLEFIVRVFVPYSFKVEIRSVHEPLEECEIARVADCFICIVVAVG